MGGSRSDKMLHHQLDKRLKLTVFRKLRAEHLVPAAPNHEWLGHPVNLPRRKRKPATHFEWRAGFAGIQILSSTGLRGEMLFGLLSKWWIGLSGRST